MGSETLTRRSEKIRDYIDANRKSPLVGSLYALVFGPLGCIYTGPKSSVIGVFAAIALGLIYWPLIVLAIVGVAMVASLPAFSKVVASNNLVTAGDQLHGDVGLAFSLPDLVDRADVRVVELGGHARLSEQTRTGGFVGRHRRFPGARGRHCRARDRLCRWRRGR